MLTFLFIPQSSRPCIQIGNVQRFAEKKRLRSGQYRTFRLPGVHWGKRTLSTGRAFVFPRFSGDTRPCKSLVVAGKVENKSSEFSLFPESFDAAFCTQNTLVALGTHSNLVCPLVLARAAAAATAVFLFPAMLSALPCRPHTESLHRNAASS